jgi:hypothetical protein
VLQDRETQQQRNGALCDRVHRQEADTLPSETGKPGKTWRWVERSSELPLIAKDEMERKG